MPKDVLPLAVPPAVGFSDNSYFVQAQEDDVVSVNTDLVVLNVTVTDKAGEYVPGLRKADFKLYEDGK